MKHILSDTGIRPTKARIWIMEHLIRSNSHPSTEELNMALREKGCLIPPATLYQNLEKLTAEGLLIRFKGIDGQARYDANLALHHHLICRICNRVRDIRLDTPLTSLLIRDDKTGNTVENWTLENAAIELKGICPDCDAALRS